MDNHIELPRGINYAVDTRDTQTSVFHEKFNRRLDDPALQEELHFIKEQLHCNAVRIFGNTPRKIIRVAHAAQRQGLTPWLSPRFINTSFEKMSALFGDFCTAAIREGLESFPLIVANELAIDCTTDPMTAELIPSDPEAKGKYLVEHYYKQGKAIDSTKHVADLIHIARDAGWKGPLSYAALSSEKIDWRSIDDPNLIVGMNLYWKRNYKEDREWTDAEYEARLQEVMQSAGDRPVAITEFGAVPQQGALGYGGAAYKREGDLDYEAQKAAYERYLPLLQKNKVGYFAYTFHEPKEHPDEYDKSTDYSTWSEADKGKYCRSRLHASYGIGIKGPDHRVSSLNPAGHVMAEFNRKAVVIAGATLETA